MFLLEIPALVTTGGVEVLLKTFHHKHSRLYFGPVVLLAVIRSVFLILSWFPYVTLCLPLA